MWSFCYNNNNVQKVGHQFKSLIKESQREILKTGNQPRERVEKVSSQMERSINWQIQRQAKTKVARERIAAEKERIKEETIRIGVKINGQIEYATINPDKKAKFETEKMTVAQIAKKQLELEKGEDE